MGVHPAIEWREAVGDGFQQPSTLSKPACSTLCRGWSRGPSRWPVNQSSEPQDRMGTMHPRYRIRSCLAVTPRMLFPRRPRAMRALWALVAMRTACSVHRSLESNHSPSHRRGLEGMTVKFRPGPRASFRMMLVEQMAVALRDLVKCIHSVLAESSERPREAKWLASTP